MFRAIEFHLISVISGPPVTFVWPLNSAVFQTLEITTTAAKNLGALTTSPKHCNKTTQTKYRVFSIFLFLSSRHYRHGWFIRCPAAFDSSRCVDTVQELSDILVLHFGALVDQSRWNQIQKNYKACRNKYIFSIFIYSCKICIHICCIHVLYHPKINTLS